MPKPKTKEHILNEEEIYELKRSAVTPKERLLVFGLLYTGMRISEFLHLRRSWFSPDGRSLTVPRTQKCSCCECRKKGGVWTSKTEDANRPVPILPEVSELFKGFFSKHNRVMDVIPNRFRAWITLKRVAKRARIKHKVFPHSLRGTFATILAEKGFDEFSLRQVFGWKNISTASSYIRMSKSKLMKEFDKKWGVVYNASTP